MAIEGWGSVSGVDIEMTGRYMYPVWSKCELCCLKSVVLGVGFFFFFWGGGGGGGGGRGRGKLRAPGRAHLF